MGWFILSIIGAAIFLAGIKHLIERALLRNAYYNAQNKEYKKYDLYLGEKEK